MAPGPTRARGPPCFASVLGWKRAFPKPADEHCDTASPIGRYPLNQRAALIHQHMLMRLNSSPFRLILLQKVNILLNDKDNSSSVCSLAPMSCDFQNWASINQMARSDSGESSGAF
jgi:hypothetical protein